MLVKLAKVLEVSAHELLGLRAPKSVTAKGSGGEDVDAFPRCRVAQSRSGPLPRAVCHTATTCTSRPGSSTS